MKNIQVKHTSFWICLALTLVTAAVYYQACTYGFVNYDDNIYVYDNSNIQTGITLQSIKWAFTTGYANFWHPLTWLSHMLDWQVYGANAGGHHITNLILHIANTLLLFLVFKRMTNDIWPSAFVAALFALHPLHVESVAWVSERKDVLSVFFWLLTMWAYVRYVENPKLKWYLTALVLFVLGLMAKPMLVTLPFVFLLLDYWPFQRKISWRLLVEKIPFIVLSAVLSVVAFLAQQSGGAITNLAGVGMDVRIFNALISYVKYIGKMFWPSGLAVYYPLTSQKIPVLYVLTSAVVLLAVTIFVLRFAKKHRYLITGWFWYLGTLLPVIGIVQVGDHAMADRYSYITLTGLFIIIAWALPDLLKKRRYKKIVLTLSAMLVITTLTICTYFQIRYWRSNITLFQHALDVTKNNYLAHFSMTQPLLEQGLIEDAIRHNSEALRIKPDYVEAFDGLGVAFRKAGNTDKAIACYQKALEINPGFDQAHLNLADALAAKGNFAMAVTHYEIGLKTMDTPGIRSNFASALLNLGRFNDAVIEYRKALSITPDDPDILNNLGYALARTGAFDEAISLYNKALQIVPAAVNVRLNLGFALTGSGKFEQAEKEYEKILLIQPQNIIAHNDFGVLLIRQWKLDEAAVHFNLALKIAPDYTDAMNNLKFVMTKKQETQTKTLENTKK